MRRSVISPWVWRMLSWLICSVNSFSSMVSVRGTDREKRLLKFFILFMMLRSRLWEKDQTHTWCSLLLSTRWQLETYRTFGAAAAVDLYVRPDQRRPSVSSDNEAESSRTAADQYSLPLRRLHNHGHSSAEAAAARSAIYACVCFCSLPCKCLWWVQLQLDRLMFPGLNNPWGDYGQREI